ncbi:MAG: hypothetical protein ABIL68_09995 [bacterium]
MRTEEPQSRQVAHLRSGFSTAVRFRSTATDGAQFQVGVWKQCPKHRSLNRGRILPASVDRRSGGRSAGSTYDAPLHLHDPPAVRLGVLAPAGLVAIEDRVGSGLHDYLGTRNPIGVRNAPRTRRADRPPGAVARTVLVLQAD